MKKILGLFFLFFLFAPLAEAACPSGVTASACYYVATTGNNSNSCSTAENISTPKQTIASGVSCLAPGRILYIRAGTYNATIDTNNLAVPNGTSWSNVVTIAKYPGDGNVTLLPTSGLQVVGIAKDTNQYIVIDGLILDATNMGSSGNALSIWGAHHIKVTNSEMKNAAKHGVKIADNSHHNEIIGCKSHDNGTSATLDHGFYIEGDDNILDRCDFYNNAANGGQIYNGGNGLDAKNNVLKNSRLFDNVRNGAVLSSGSNNVAYNNLFWDNTLHGLQVSSNCSGCKVYNNTSYSNTGEGIRVQSPASSTVIRNNISAANAGGNMTNAGSSTTYSNNLCFGSGGTTSCAVTSDPGLIAAGSDNFALSSNSSSAAGAGVDLSPTILKNGSLPDIGAHQIIDFAGAVIPNQTTDDQMVITFVNNVFPPLLPATNCTGFTVKKSAVAQTINTCTRTANNQITLTMATPFVNGDNITLEYATTGNVSDSALFGKVNNQRLNAISSTIISTAGLDGGTPPPPPPTSSLVQLVYRFESYGGTETTPDSIYPVNTPIRIPPNTCTRLRILICNGDVALGNSGYSPYASRNSGTYSVIPDGPALTTGISFSAGTGTPPPELITGAYTTEQLAGPGTFLPGGVQLSSNETPDVNLLANEDTEFVAALCVGAGNSAGTTFDIRWRKAGGVVLDTYTQTPQIIISGGTSQVGAR